MSDDPTLNIKGKLDLSEARRELASFSDEAAIGMVARGGGGGSPARGGGLGRIDELASQSRITSSQHRYAAAMDRMAQAMERQASAIERDALSSGGSGGGSSGGGGGRGGFMSHLPFGRGLTAMGILATASRLGAAYRDNSIEAAAAAGDPVAMAQHEIHQQQRIADAVPFGVGRMGLYLRDPTGGEVIGIERTLKSAQLQDATTAAQFGIAGFNRSLGRSADMSETRGDFNRQRLSVTQDRERANETIRSQFGSAAETIDKEHQATLGAIDARRQRHRSLFHLPDRLANKIVGSSDPFDDEADSENESFAKRKKMLQEQEDQAHKDADRRASGERERIQNAFEMDAAGVLARRDSASDVSSGMSTVGAGRQSILRRHGLETKKAIQDQRDTGYMRRLEEAQGAELAAYDFHATRDALWAGARNAGGTTAARLRGENNPIMANVTMMQTSHEAEMNQVMAHNPALAEGVAARQEQEKAAFMAHTMRGIRNANMSSAGQTEVIKRQLARDPLGAELLANDNAAADELRSMDSFTAMFRVPQINAQKWWRGQQILQKFNDSRQLDLIGLRGGFESSGLRASGKEYSASANDIVTGTNERAAAYAQRGPMFNEERNLTIGAGVNELKAMRRRIQYGGYGEAIDSGSLGPSPGTETRVDEESNAEVLKRIDDGIQKLVSTMTGAGNQ